MSVESNIFSTLTALTAGRVFPDVAPLSTVKPYITYTQVGGEAVSKIAPTVSNKKHGRFQINVWANTRASASILMLQVEASMVQASTFNARALDAPSSAYDNDMLTYSSMQDFSVWSDR